mgnify:CR=1 FL=1
MSIENLLRKYPQSVPGNSIHIRDPYIMLYGDKYYLYGTTKCLRGKEDDGFEVW